MYIPKKFAMTDEAELEAFVHDHSFGVLMSTTSSGPMATHLPFLFDSKKQVLYAHMAMANPHWQELNGQSTLVVFSGPHAYISPSWYGNQESVPTWNYVAVHMYGQCTLIEDETELRDVLRNTVLFYEPTSDLPDREEEPFYHSLARGVVGFRIDVQRIEGAAKLSQNKSKEIQQRVVEQLSSSDDANARDVALRMKRNLLKLD